MKKLLWISPAVPYDAVSHAGGKTHNYYIKYFQKSGQYDIHLISLAEVDEVPLLDAEQYGISSDVCVVGGNLFKNVFRMAYNMNSLYNKRHPLCQTILSYQYRALKKRVKNYAKKNQPEIVIMQWTGAAFLLPYVQELFPQAKTVIIEEDVTFLGYQRRYEQEKDARRRARYRYSYEHLKEKELNLLQRSSIVVVNNDKDRRLLADNGIEESKIYTAAAYYDDYSSVGRKHIERKVLFYGGMHREENHRAAMWFAKNVMPLLKDDGIIFEVVGNHPRKEWNEVQSDKIQVEGFVEDVSPYFEHCLCMVAPLELGAGVKVKILEGLSAGIPVLTNTVGIEGIAAQDGKEYIHCDMVQDYVAAIRKLLESPELGKQIGENARQFMKNHYNLDRTLDGLMKVLE